MKYWIAAVTGRDSDGPAESVIGIYPTQVHAFLGIGHFWYAEAARNGTVKWDKDDTNRATLIYRNGAISNYELAAQVRELEVQQ